MNKKVVIVHGWGFTPEHNWYQWLGDKLRSEGFEVIIPEMPETETPHIESWVSKLAEVAGEIDENTYFVGHSIGCSTILHYLERAPNECGGVFLVGGWMMLNEGKLAEEVKEFGPIVREIADEWIVSMQGMQFPRVRAKAPGFTVFLSEDDYYVPRKENKILFLEKLGAEVISMDGKGHFTTEDGVSEVPEVLEKMKEIIT